jgi:hypothetical protein
MYDPDRGSRGAGEQESRGEGEFFISDRPLENINSLTGETPIPQEFLQRSDRPLKNINSLTGETPIPQEFLEKSNDRALISHKLRIPLAPGEIQGEADVGDELFNSIEVEDRGEFAFDIPEIQRKPKNSDLADGLIGDKVESSPMISNRLSVPSPRSDAGIVAASFDNNRVTVISSPNQEDTRLHQGAEFTQSELKQKPPNFNSRKDEQIERLPIPNYPSPITNYQLPITPTIRVSIGRIEVRAIPTPPAPPAPQKSPPTPKLSLSEYLRKNGGGG